MAATFDFYIADSLCCATYEAAGATIRVLSILNVAREGYHHPVRLNDAQHQRELYETVAALIANDRAAA
jgi:hypothetical protein